ncbi:hypothetical protein DC345_16285 [Paenibacillus taichungensis]|uniref:AAA+ ATPase domain-containing protein n=1 Tax=Paenibacillus taichungensis TaxID=484184 RepID=A0A329QQ87_9BACL|nr:SIR2 family protein [Paenibacillus taichungensis]RAW14504.1 hypothetical protein DC345_16285 [Paenibacillus taichungensis]
MKQQIIEAIKENKLLLFIGAGFSQPLNFPSWNGLISLVLKGLASEDDKYKRLEDVLDTGLFTSLEVLDKIKDKKKQVYEVLYREIDKSLDGLNLELHQKVGKVSSKIITTNYDRLLETATNFRKVVFDNTFHIANLQDKENFLLKLHGCIENPEKCILFQDDYDQLYKETAAIEKLKNLVADHTILFIGFSLSDEYVKKQFEYIHAIYKGFSRQHYYLTVESNASEMHGVHPILLNNWSELGPFLDSLIEIKGASSQISGASETIVGNIAPALPSLIVKEVSIALLMAAPIDQENKPYFEKVTKHLAKFKVTIECFYFSLEVLRNLEGFNYIIILSQTVKDKIVIEDQYLKSKLITLEEIEENLISDLLKGIFIFTDKKTQMTTPSISIPLAVLWETDLSSVFFKLFQRKTLNNFINGFIVNLEKFDLNLVEKGNSKVVTRIDESKQILSENIDAKNLVNFVGRKTDMEDITRKVIDTNKQVLTIKGSGGIGKTTTVKKIAIELFERGFYLDGIYFIDCEFITHYKSFEYKVAQCFGIESTINLKEHILQNNIELDAVIIMDNFETLLYIKERDEVKALVAFLCDYVNIVITSREWVQLEFEERHEMRAFTNEEAFELFGKYYKSSLNTEEIKILKEDILGKLLNNNPLAIKITARNLPKSKNMAVLKKDLEEDFFNITKDDYEDIFDDETDSNIERSKSLYQSIAYSYKSLKVNEKLLFELLYLFPDGIHMNNIKNFFSQSDYKRDSKKVTDREITSLENKSLIEINRGFIKLQSIIGRFAEHQFVKRSEEEKVDFYKRAFYYMNFLGKMLYKMYHADRTLGLKIFDQNVENFIKSYSYITAFDDDQDEKIQFIVITYQMFDLIHQTQQFSDKIEKIKHHFDVAKSNVLFEVIVANAKYNEGDFEEGYNRLKKSVSIEEMYKLDHTVELEKDIVNLALEIYMYSNVNEVRKFVKESNFHNQWNIIRLLFYSGEYGKIEELLISNRKKISPFTLMEMKLNTNKLEYDELETVISNSFYRKEYTQLMQIHYIKAKMIKLDKKTINRLVVTDRYTSGLKSLMLAFIETDEKKTINFYENAIHDLQSIRYYYTEAIYYYSKFLLNNGLDEEKNWFNKGLLLAEQNHYSFLHHKFNCLLEGLELPYIESQYILSEMFQLDSIIGLNKYTDIEP